MALVWIDGFGHYDGLRANLLLGAYSTASAGVLVSSSSPRTGSHCLRMNAGSSGTLTKALPSALDTLGVGFGFYAGGSYSSNLQLIQFQNLSGVANATLMLNVDGSISLRRGTIAGTVLFTTDPCVTYGAWNHIEFRIHFSNTVGTFEIRVNGIPVDAATGSGTGLDTVETATIECSILSFLIENRNATPAPDWGYGDLFIWDTSGSTNNDFLGDRKVVTLDPDDNTSTAEWTATGAATGVQAINTTNDGDTSYITASDSVPVTSEFELENPDGTVGAIAGVMSVSVARKVESGTAIISQQMVVSSSSTSDGDHSISDEYTYYHTVHETNPATGLPWSSAALASARLRLRRTT